MGGGVGGFIYISDEEENVSRVSEAGRVYLADSYQRVKNHSPINVSSASGGSTFESVAVGKVILRSESGNSMMWWGGTGDDAPFSGHGFPLWGGEKTKPIPVTNFNAIRVFAAVSGDILYAIGFLNGPDVVLPNTTPEHPVVPAETVKPLLISTSPTSGFSGVALSSEISATFDEEMSDSVSGYFTLSPAHNITAFKGVTDVNSVFITPTSNLSGSTVYYVGINPGLTDLAGNNVSGAPIVFPFTTQATPPPPDVTKPWVSGTTPASGATGASAAGNVTVVFSEPMLSGTINAQNIYLSYLSGVVVTSGISGVVTLSAVDQKTATIDPTNILSGNTVVRINILSGCQDLAGNGLISGHDRSRNFTTGAVDTTPPVVSGTSPANGASNVDTGVNIVVTFSENMLSGTLNTSGVFLSTTSGGSPNPSAYSIVVSGNQKACHINPTSTLTEGQQYFINVLDQVTDLAGNTLSGTAGDRFRSFTTLYNFQQVYFVTGGGAGDMYNGNDHRIGLYLTGSACDLKGKAVKKITVRLRKVGSPSGNYSVTIRKGSDDSIVKTFGTASANSLTTSFTDYTYTDLTNTYVMTTNDKILVEYSGGDSSNKVEINRTTTGDVYPGADYIGYTTSSGYNDDSGKDIAFDVYA